MAPSRCTVCLIGPAGSGKTSLLQTFIDCIEQNTHGYEQRRRIQAQDIEASVFDTGIEVAPKLLSNQNGDYQTIRRQFFTKTVATDSTLDYYFRLDVDGLGARDPILMRVVDSAGEFAIPEGDARRDRAEDQIEKLREALQQSDAIVVAIPLTRLDGVGWQSSLQRIIADLSHPTLKNPTRIVIAFTQYERLFVNLGQSAFEFACLPRVAADVIRRALDQATWPESLNNLRRRDVDVYFTVTSAYGFVKGYGNPNIDPHQLSEEMPFGRNGTASNIRRFWRPFLTAEPFICAALNQPSNFAIPYEDFFGSGGRRAVGPPPIAVPKGAGFWHRTSKKAGKVFNWFNRHSG